jgi:CubicO group peptidase (beta-lactamase class C family)
MNIRAISSLCLVPAVAWAQASRPNSAELNRRIAAYVAPLAAHEISGTVLVARGSHVVYERSFGFANHELGVPFTPTTPSNVASVTKPMTIIITAQLAEATKLSVNDTVSKWLPEYVYGSQMTITQLLNHRAGVPHRVLPEENQTEPKTTADMVQAANKVPLLFTPGEKSVYSSGGFAILAAVLERVSGKSYDALLQEYVAAPVGAHMIRHADHRELLAGRATPVIPIGNGVLNAPLSDLSFLVGGGSVYTTPRDLLAVMNGVVSGTYGRAAREALWRNDGLHWNGLTNGYRATADWRASDSLVIIITANAHTGAIDLLRGIIPRLADGERMPPAQIPKYKAVALSSAAQKRIAGNYDTGGGSTSTLSFYSPSVALFGDRALVALNDSTFYSTADYAKVVFVSGVNGAVSELRWGSGTWATKGEDGPRFARVASR